MNGFWKNFFLRGLMCCGFGPLTLAVIYFILGASGAVTEILPQKAAAEILSITLMAFVIAGMTAIYQTEKLPLPICIGIHGLVLYGVYLLVYLLNGWLASEAAALMTFSVVFFAGFAGIWVIIYLVNKKKVKKLNEALKK